MAGLNILIARTGALTIPTINLLPRLFGLQGDDIGDAVLYEAWLEVWLVCAVVVIGLDRTRQVVAATGRIMAMRLLRRRPHHLRTPPRFCSGSLVWRH